MSNQSLDVNWAIEEEAGDDNGYTALHQASLRNCDTIAAILLAHPAIDLNQQNAAGESPFFLACFMGSTSCVRLLLKDSRVDVNIPGNSGCHPFQNPAMQGYGETIKWYIASGREINQDEVEDVLSDAIAIATENGEAEVTTLLEKFKENPEDIRHRMRMELGWYDEAAAEVLALVVFASDGFLEIKGVATTNVTRYFGIARQLPLELQMVLCYHAVGLPSKDVIPGKKREVAFKDLANRLCWASFLAPAAS